MAATFIKTRHAFTVALIASCGIASGCDDEELLGDSAVDAGTVGGDGTGDGADDSDGTPMDGADAADGEGPGDGSEGGGMMDAGSMDSGTTGGGDEPDIVYGDDCVETFVYDPAGRDDVVSVSLAGGNPFVWAATQAEGALPMHLDEDGKWRLRVALPTLTVPYKFVVNGETDGEPEWTADSTNECKESDGYGAFNSILYACQDAPVCTDGGDDGSDVDAGVDMDAGADMDAGTGTGDAGSTSSDDAGLESDGGISTASDAGLADAGAAVDAGPVVPDYDLGDGCVETFVFDPKAYPHITSTITSVEVRGAAPFDWSGSGIMLTKDLDGVWRADIEMSAGDVEYKLVVNDGSNWEQDRAYCSTAATGATQNSLRKACATPPSCCKNVKVTFNPVAAGCGSNVSSVELAGALTDNWSKRAPLTKGGDGSYSLTFPTLVPGSYEYKVVVGGTTYIPVNDTNCSDDSEGNSQLVCTP